MRLESGETLVVQPNNVEAIRLQNETYKLFEDGKITVRQGHMTGDTRTKHAAASEAGGGCRQGHMTGDTRSKHAAAVARKDTLHTLVGATTGTAFNDLTSEYPIIALVTTFTCDADDTWVQNGRAVTQEALRSRADANLSGHPRRAVVTTVLRDAQYLAAVDDARSRLSKHVGEAARLPDLPRPPHNDMYSDAICVECETVCDLGRAHVAQTRPSTR